MTKENNSNNKIKTSHVQHYWILFFLLAAFIGPIIAAWSLFSDKSFMPDTLNHGALINPPLVFQELPLTSSNKKSLTENTWLGKWLIVYVNPKACDKACENNLYFMRQIRTALGANMDRVLRVYVTYQHTLTPDMQKLLATEYNGTLLAYTKSHDLSEFLTTLSTKQNTLENGYIYIVDPLGNVMMSYPTTQKPKDILVDLKKLLNASQIG